MTNSGTNNVSVIDTATNKVVASRRRGGQSGAVVVTPDGKRAYVTNHGSNDVSVIDTAANQLGGHGRGWDCPHWDSSYSKRETGLYGEF